MIRRSRRPVAALLASAIFLASAAPALAHGASLTVEPATAKPGDTVTVTGEDLGASRAIDLKLTGTGVEVVLGRAKTDDDGGFSEKYTLPADLRPGRYLVATQTGEGEAVSADLTVAAAAAANSGASATSSAAFQPRERPFGQVLALVVVFGILAGLGLFLARFTGGSRGSREERTVPASGAEHA